VSLRESYLATQGPPGTGKTFNAARQVLELIGRGRTVGITGLNVATSRARALAVVVASPRLVPASCATPRQMSLVNALCRAWESSG
jgi:hypothetical protein